MWRNWSGEQACIPARLARPGSAREVGEELERAAAADHVVRAVGAGHSFNDAAVTEGTMLSLDAMDRVVDVDRATGLVRVQAGIRLHALSDALAEHGLALENLGDVNVQSLAGAIATATHGSGAGLGNLSSQVAGLQLVDGRGEVHELRDGDELRAARVAVGSLGVVTEATLRCVPDFTLRGVDATAPLGEVLDRMDELAAGSRHFEFYVFPHSDLALTRTNTAHDGPPRPPSAARRWAEDVLLTNHAFRLACELAKRVPGAIPAIDRTLARAYGSRTRIDRADRIFASPRLVRFVETELALPAHAARPALDAMLDAARHFPVVFPIEVRYVAADDALISPHAGRASVTISLHNFVGMPWEPYFRAAHAIGEEHDARPHWGKRHFHTAQTLAPRYPEWETFQAIRRRFDPDGLFANAYVRRVLGPLSAQPAG